MFPFRFLLGALLFGAVAPVLAQPYLTGLSATWSDEFHEWTLYGEEEDQEGTLQLRFPARRSYTDWTYQLADQQGRIQPKWPDRRDEWELRSGATIVTARALWRNDPREWRVSDGTYTLTFRTRYGNRWDEWELRDNRLGDFRIYTDYENDPRDWTIEDGLAEELPFGLRIMLTYIALYHALPLE